MSEKQPINWLKIERWGEDLNKPSSPPNEDSLLEINRQILTILTSPVPEYVKEWAAKRAKEIMRGK